MSVVVSFRLDAFIVPSRDFFRADQSNYDFLLGKELRRVSGGVTSSQYVTLVREGIENPPWYAAHWRSAFQDIGAAARWVSVLTGSPVIQALAELILSNLGTLERSVEISDVTVNGMDAKDWLRQQSSKDLPGAAEAITEIVDRARGASLAETPAKLLSSPTRLVSTILILIALAAIWAWIDESIRALVNEPKSPIKIQIVAAISTAEPEAIQANEARAAGSRLVRPEPDCIPIRIQRGSEAVTICAQSK